MNKNLKIYIAGHRGLVGSAIKREVERKGYTNIVFKTHSELDLTDSKAVAEFFEQEKPDWVVQAAAKVGGILGNNTYPVEFMLENLKIQNNIIENCYKHNVKKLLFLVGYEERDGNMCGTGRLRAFFLRKKAAKKVCFTAKSRFRAGQLRWPGGALAHR